MSIITKRQILEKIKNNEIGIIPTLDAFQIQSNSIDLRLGFTFMIPKRWHITNNGRETMDILNFNTNNSKYFDIIELEEGQYFDILPGEYIIVSTLETIKIPNNLMAILYPRSSTNRKGLSLDLTGIIDSGYEGQLTLPIKNNTQSHTIRIYPGERFCQIIFETLTEEIKPIKSRYHNKDIIEGVAKEKNSESTLILKGKIKQLKTDHKVNIE